MEWKKDFGLRRHLRAVYLINRSPSSAIDFKIPEELWSGFKPSLSHLRRFGCSAYVHSVKSKTSTRATKGYFIGYPQGTTGFRVWMPEERICVVSINVIFHEEEVFKDSVKQESKRDSSCAKRGQVKKVDKGKGKKVSFSPDLIEGPTSCLHDLEASVSGTATESTVSGGVSSGSVTEGGSVESESGSTTEGEQDLEDYILERERSRKMPSKFDDFDVVAYALAAAQDIEIYEPRSYAEAMRTREIKEWNASNVEEMIFLEKNGTWDLVK